MPTIHDVIIYLSKIKIQDNRIYKIISASCFIHGEEIIMMVFDIVVW